MATGDPRLHAIHAIALSRDEARQRIDSYFEQHPTLTEVLHTRSWTAVPEKDVLHADSIFGSGTITLTDGGLEIDLQLSLLGQAARSTITNVLSSALLQLLSEPPE